ncbi:1,4-dihydroxy-2-naphthoate polyprenyltransferase [Carboxylicivirga linearis]|uniref:1,4-dihydroxy-2-naphthoate octaprenyltransferase n=1 Tax=Carboxylicivirga linearis TaxID=1628157 RepID=A0ABS5JUT1_9BACT|nr:1,4-dihydroxy-2-naphthoate polyprenyltransferase [Carboxylicivirga linearis]MBS2098603.1 1,4-dihydroxy-2-naphthoate polyprenyltransferase [Carboxylicivirga linearis]
MSSVKAWITAFRLRTLPLAFSSILAGSFVAEFYNCFQWPVLLLALFTTLFLQILSNLANDYGDTVNGADHEGRLGPQRMVQSGMITLSQMRIAIVIFSVLSFLSGIGLIYISFGGFIQLRFLLFLLLGMAAIAAALKYTMGSNPYGYKGLGDFYVLVFFGLTGVGGTYFLHSNNWDWTLLLPAFSIGFLSTGVLNVNNMRDIKSDQVAGKRTLVVKIGLNSAKVYHYSLIILSVVLLVVFSIINKFSLLSYLYLAGVPLLFLHMKAIKNAKVADDFDPQLKKLALSTLVLVLLFGLGIMIG